MTTRIFGSGIRRREDPRLITGQASYTDDIKLTNMAYAAILRSPHAHARNASTRAKQAHDAQGGGGPDHARLDPEAPDLPGPIFF